MTKDIKYYLHLYLGCEVEWGFDGRKKKGVLIGKDERYGWQIFDPLNVIVPYQYCRTDLLKPLLRPLSDMNEEEAREFFGKIMNLNKQFQITRYGFQWKKEKGYISVYDHSTNKWYVIIKPSGNSEIPCFNCTYAMEEVLWLLKQGFDISGLIEAGLAINKTKFEK